MQLMCGFVSEVWCLAMAISHTPHALFVTELRERIQHRLLGVVINLVSFFFLLLFLCNAEITFSVILWNKANWKSSSSSLNILTWPQSLGLFESRGMIYNAFFELLTKSLGESNKMYGSGADLRAPVLTSVNHEF